MNDTEMKAGTVRFFNDQKGWGFLRPDDGSPDVFCHYSDIAGTGRRSLRDDQRVRFSVVETDRGLRAKNITPA